MPVSVNRIYEPAAGGDGYRVLVGGSGTIPSDSRSYAARDTEHNEAVVLADLLRSGERQRAARGAQTRRTLPLASHR